MNMSSGLSETWFEKLRDDFRDVSYMAPVDLMFHHRLT